MNLIRGVLVAIQLHIIRQKKKIRAQVQHVFKLNRTTLSEQGVLLFPLSNAASVNKGGSIYKQSIRIPYQPNLIYQDQGDVL